MRVLPLGRATPLSPHTFPQAPSWQVDRDAAPTAKALAAQRSVLKSGKLPDEKLAVLELVERLAQHADGLPDADTQDALLAAGVTQQVCREFTAGASAQLQVRTPAAALEHVRLGLGARGCRMHVLRDRGQPA
jgi:alkylhydroperoxidase family enzyme